MIQPKDVWILISRGWSPNKTERDEIVKESKQILYDWNKKMDY